MPALLLTAWAFLKNLPWKWIAIAFAILFVVREIERFGYHERDGEVALWKAKYQADEQTIANMKAASAQAAAANLAHVRDVETKQAQITKEQTDALSRQLADARAAASAYVVRHPAQTVAGHAGTGGISEVAGTAGQTDAAPQSAVVAVSDIDACTDAYVIARGWQDWWGAISASPNSPPPMAR